MNQGEIVLSFLFKANKQLVETVKKEINGFDCPASGLEVGIALYFFAFLTSGMGMGNVLKRLNALPSPANSF